jgi:hypothetical protein
MPLQKLQFRPGVNRESTTLANEGGWFEADNVRFRSGQPEKIGGWQADSGVTTSALLPPTNPAPLNPASFWGVCRSMWNWLNLSGFNLLALGTSLKYYIQNGVGGYFYDITPIRDTNTGTATFTATNGSSTITVTDVSNGADAGDFVTFSNAIALSTQTYTANATTDKISFTTALADGTTLELFTTSAAPAGLSTGTTYYVVNSDTPTASCKLSLTAGGAAINITGTGTGTQTFALTTGITAGVLNAEFQIASILNADQYTIETTATATAFDTGTGGASTVAEYQLNNSTTVATVGSGWGAGPWGGYFTNANASALNGAINSSTTTITVDSTTGFSTAPGILLIEQELITYGAKSATQFTSCVRGVQGTVAAAHADNTIVDDAVTFTGWDESSAPTTNTPQLRLWSESNYGEDLIINPRDGAMYYWATLANPNTFQRAKIIAAGGTVTTKAGTATVDSTCPSLVNQILVSDSSRFLIAFGCNDPSGVLFSTTQDPMLVRWSNQEEFYTWNPAADNQAGDFRLSNGSQIIATIQTRQEILVLTNSAIYSMQYLGPPYVWGFQIMGDNISVAGPNVVATANNITYWMGVDKFYMYSGRVETLPSTLRQYVFDNINLSQSSQFFAGTNEGYNEIWWFYCSANSTTVDRYVIFDNLERTWSYGNMARTSWLDSALRDVPLATNYESQLLYHETGNDDGSTNPPSPIASYIQSSDFDIGDGHNFGLVSRILPDLTFDGSTSSSPTVNFTVRPRQFPGTNYGPSDSPDVQSANNFQVIHTYNVQQFTEQVFVRIRGRQMALKISSSGIGVAWQLGAPRMDVRPDGRR